MYVDILSGVVKATLYNGNLEQAVNVYASFDDHDPFSRSWPES